MSASNWQSVMQESRLHIAEGGVDAEACSCRFSNRCHCRCARFRDFCDNRFWTDGWQCSCSFRNKAQSCKRFFRSVIIHCFWFYIHERMHEADPVFTNKMVPFLSVKCIYKIHSKEMVCVQKPLSIASLNHINTDFHNISFYILFYVVK